VPTSFLDQPRAVREGEALDVARLEPYLRARFPDVQGPLAVEQFPQGYSNLTYLLRLGSREMVLRRPPFGNQVKSAHDMAREYRVLSRLAAVYPPAPAPYVYCEDEGILGAPFYIMERRTGVILRKTVPAGLALEPATLRRLCESLVDALAQLHTLDYKAAGLADLGKPQGYLVRQVSGWTRRYRDAQTEDVPAMDRVADWLAGHLPVESGAALIHNDFKFDNVLFDADDITRVAGVFDWEMATVGDPLMDLGTTLGYWVEAGDPETLKSFVVGPTNLPGSLSRHEVLERYRQKTGRDVRDLLFFYCFGLFKIAVIVQQIYARYARGFTRDPRFAPLNHVVAQMSAGAVQALDRGGM
jgi:aminoglycoside phosphotransferase (APT) family kinase protein